MGQQLTAAEMMKLSARTVDDPMMTDAELIHQRALRSDKRIGKIGVTENAMTRIGALCFIRDRLNHHEKAAEWFKSAYEALYGSAMPAVDAGRQPVDTSATAHDNGMAARLDQASDLQALIVGSRLRHIPPLLTSASRDRITACVVFGIAAGSEAPRLPSGFVNRRSQKRAVAELLADLDRVAEIRGWKATA